MSVFEKDKVRLKSYIRKVLGIKEIETARIMFKCPFDGECRLSNKIGGRIRWSDEELEVSR